MDGVTEVKTISELMAGKELGAVRIRRLPWSQERFFAPYFKTKESCWHGKTDGGEPDWYADSCVWELYVEKPKTVVLYEWMQFSGGQWLINDFLETEIGAAIRWSDTKYKKTGREFAVEEGEE